MPKKRHISLKDLAKELGVSVSTVSRALNDSYEIGPEMRERVKALAEEYAPYYRHYRAGYCHSFLFVHNQRYQ